MLYGLLSTIFQLDVANIEALNAGSSRNKFPALENSRMRFKRPNEIKFELQIV